MSDFDDFMNGAYAAARDVFGEEQFRITGKTLATPLTVEGSWNEVGTTQEMTLNGETVTFNAMVQIAVSEFRGKAPVAGQLVTRLKDGRTFRIVG